MSTYNFDNLDDFEENPEIELPDFPSYNPAAGENAFGRKVCFEDERHGYNKEQVDSYIEELSAEYNNMYRLYLKAERDNVFFRSQSETIGRTLLNAEILAKQIIDDARADASQIVGEAQTRAETIPSGAPAPLYAFSSGSEKNFTDAPFFNSGEGFVGGPSTKEGFADMPSFGNQNNFADISSLDKDEGFTAVPVAGKEGSGGDSSNTIDFTGIDIDLEAMLGEYLDMVSTGSGEKNNGKIA